VSKNNLKLKLYFDLGMGAEDKISFEKGSVSRKTLATTVIEPLQKKKIDDG